MSGSRRKYESLVTRRGFLAGTTGAALSSFSGCILPGSDGGGTGTGEDVWGTYQQNLSNSGHNPNTGVPKSKPNVGWGLRSEKQIISSPAVVDGSIYFGNNAGKVYSVNAEVTTRPEEEEWSFQTGNIVHSSPAVADGTVYVGSNDGKLYSLNADDGAKEWEFDSGDEWVFGSPKVENNTVYFGSITRSERTGHLYALDTGGEEKWSYEVEGGVLRTPAVSDDGVYFGSVNGNLHALNKGGEERWNFGTGSEISGIPSVGDGTVYFGDLSGTFYAVTESGEEDWSFDTGYPIRYAPAFDGSTVYVGTGSDQKGVIYALDTDGNEEWRFEADSQITTSPAVGDGTVVAGTLNTNLYGVNASNGKTRWRYGDVRRTIYSSPALTNDSIYFGSNDRTIYAISTKNLKG